MLSRVDMWTEACLTSQAFLGSRMWSVALDDGSRTASSVVERSRTRKLPSNVGASDSR
jgi:hypothetical protein